MSSGLSFEFNLGQRAGAAKKIDSQRFRILVLGNFGGTEPAASAVAHEAGARRIHAVDVDNFDAVMQRVAPGVRLGPDAPVLRPQSLDDFHPDRIVSLVPELRRLMELRSSLADPATAREVLDTLGWRQPQSEQPEAPAAPEESTDDAIERLLGKAPAPERRPAASVVDKLVSEAVAPHVQPPPDPTHAVLAAGLERKLADETRRVLHWPEFQELEAAWRALWWLVSGLETGESLAVDMLDLGREALLDDMAAGNVDPERGILGRTLAAHGTGQLGAERWSLVVGAFAFAAEIEDLKLLALLGATTGALGAPFVAAAHESLLGCDSIAGSPDPNQWGARDPDFEAAWRALRGSAIARWIGLALPRLALRLPYGKDTDAVSAFPFEEATAPGDPGALLWGSPAIGCALLVGRAFQDEGWNMQPDDRLEIDDLPAYSYRVEGESRLLPVAEHYLTDRQAEAILARGIMPFVSHRQVNLARLLRFQSLADPPAALQGAWL